jgi:transposase
MLITPRQITVFASLAPTDMRKSLTGLIGIVEKELGQQIENGDLFLFFNRRRDRLKVLFFTGDGTVILYKHLERGTFEPLRGADRQRSAAPPAPCLTLSIDELRWLLDGIDLSSVKRRARWRREEAIRRGHQFSSGTFDARRELTINTAR